MVHLAEHAIERQLEGPEQVKDPLGAYLSFLDEIRPTSLAAQYNLHVQRGVERFVRDERYKNDPRYISLWLNIAESLGTYEIMTQNSIGMQSAAFYAAYSRSLASMGYLRDAIQVLSRGNAICGDIVYSVEDLKTFCPVELQKNDSVGIQLPAVPSAQPFSTEEPSIDINLLFENGTERSFEEMVLSLRKIVLSPIPRRHDPLRPPPEVPDIPDENLPGVYGYRKSNAKWALDHPPPPPTAAQPLRSRYNAKPSLSSTASYSSAATSGSSRSSVSQPSISQQKLPTKLLQNTAFEEQPVVELALSQIPPLGIQPVVDASLVSVRHVFAQIISICIKKMSPYSVQNSIERNGMPFFTKRSNLPEKLELTNITFLLRKIVGTGGYGTVFSAVNPVNNARFAIKLEKGNVPWEWYVVSMARSRLKNDRALQSIINGYYYEGFRDEQYMVMPLIGYDSLLSIANYIRTRQLSAIDAEVLTAYFSIELLRTIESLHKNKIIHGDIKAENVMLRAPGDKSIHSGYLSRIYSADGNNHWDEYGVVLIDFGRSIDLELFPPDQRFEATWSIDEDQDCWEMRRGIPWTYQPDYFGIASIAHLLLFGKYLKIREDGTSRNISESFKRSMNANLWSRFFITLLNPNPSSLPIVDDLVSLRKSLESYLTSDGPSKIHHLLTDIAYDMRRRRLI